MYIILLIGYSFSLPSAFGRSIAFGNGLHFQAVLAEFFSALIGVCLMLTSLYAGGGLISLSIALAFAISVRGLILYPIILSSLFSLSKIEILVSCFGGLTSVTLIWGVLMVIIAKSISVWSSIDNTIPLFLIGGIIWVVISHQLIIRPEDKSKVAKFFMGFWTNSK